MRKHRFFARHANPLLPAIAVLLLWPALLHAQLDPAVGNWQLNLAKSKYAPGTAPANLRVHIDAAGQGVRVTATTVRQNGQKIVVEYTAYLDGKDYAVIWVTRLRHGLAEAQRQHGRRDAKERRQDRPDLSARRVRRSENHDGGHDWQGRGGQHPEQRRGVRSEITGYSAGNAFLAKQRSSTIRPPMRCSWMMRSAFSGVTFLYHAPSG